MGEMMWWWGGFKGRRAATQKSIDAFAQYDRNSKFHVYCGSCRLNRGELQKENQGGLFLSSIKGLISPSTVVSSFPALPCFTVFNIKVKYEQLRRFFIRPRSIIVLSLWMQIRLRGTQRSHISLAGLFQQATSLRPFELPFSHLEHFSLSPGLKVRS